MTTQTPMANARPEVINDPDVSAEPSVLPPLSEPMRVDAIGLRQFAGRRGEKVLLNDISLSIAPGEFVALVGGSGSGKSTLLDALNGFRPAARGHVLVNGADYYANMSEHRHRLGYVPQDDILHRELRVEDALYFTARLRLPAGTPASEVLARVDSALDEVEMTAHRRQQISKLSGGQRKRVSIASELISRPGLLYLDEPTSGLDPVLERRLMLLLRRLADEGRTVIAVTHATANIDVCDKVAFLAPTGRLCFFGSPEDALKFFEAPSISAIYDMLDESADAPEYWECRYRMSTFYDRYIRQPQRDAMPDPLPTSPARRPETRAHPRGFRVPATHPALNMHPWRQFLILTQRYARLLWTDKLTLGILVSQAPFMGLSLMLVINSDLFADGKSFVSAQLALAMIAILAIWIGTNSASREIVKENSIYKRERLVNLGVGPYVASKVAVLSVLVLMQAALMLGVIVLKTGTPPHGVFLPGWLELYLGLVLTMMAAMALGLMISAGAKNVALAAAAAPLLVAPQMLLGGFVLPVNGVAEVMSYGMVGHWSSTAMGTTAELNRLYYQTLEREPGTLEENPLLKQVNFDPQTYDTDPGPKSAAESRADRQPRLLLYWGILGGMTATFLAGALVLQSRKDAVSRSRRSRPKALVFGGGGNDLQVKRGAQQICGAGAINAGR